MRSSVNAIEMHGKCFIFLTLVRRMELEMRVRCDAGRLSVHQEIFSRKFMERMGWRKEQVVEVRGNNISFPDVILLLLSSAELRSHCVHTNVIGSMFGCAAWKKRTKNIRNLVKFKFHTCSHHQVIPAARPSVRCRDCVHRCLFPHFLLVFLLLQFKVSALFVWLCVCSVLSLLFSFSFDLKNTFIFHLSLFHLRFDGNDNKIIRKKNEKRKTNEMYLNCQSIV